MNHRLEIHATDGVTEVHAQHLRVANRQVFTAVQPARQEELDVTEVRLVSEAIGPTVRFVLESFTLVKGESGVWTVTASEDAMGCSRYDLEYTATEQFGQKIPPPRQTTMHWNHDTD